MLIDRRLLADIERFFISYKNNSLLEKKQKIKSISQITKSEKNFKTSCWIYRQNPDISEIEYILEMFKIVETILLLYQKTEKNLFIEKCIMKKKNWAQTYEEIFIEKRTYFAWKEEILKDAAMLAIEKGLLISGIEKDIAAAESYVF